MIQLSEVLRRADFKVEPEHAAQYERLIAACRKHLPSVDEEMVGRAFRLAYWAHRNDRRASGEAYIAHPLEVATIVAEDIRADDLSVAAALLHDVVEDTEFTLDYIRQEFGREMAQLIDGLTKIDENLTRFDGHLGLDPGAAPSKEQMQAENVRKLMLSMASDFRVILVKFADRLHNMRTLGSLRPEKQRKIASETLDLYAPLARRFGLNTVKNEFEDLCLKALDPRTFFQIVEGLNESRASRTAFIDSFIDPLREILAEEGFAFDIYGRPKNIYSIYRKMRKQGKPLEEIYDLFAIRIVLESSGTQGKQDCWRVYSIITDLYKPIKERFRDFLSQPKSNGYRSLHTTVVAQEGRRVEVQIRTREMHELAERGVAAHWKYKEGSSHADGQMDDLLQWVRDLLEQPGDEAAAEFVRDFRLNLFDEEVYIFTPRGDLFTLPTGATPVDFAFHVHTEVGLHCVGAKVNGKMVPLSHTLSSGDEVEILTSKKQTPNPDWIKFVVTSKARSRIRHWINEKRRKAVEAGRKAWEKRAAREHIELDDQQLQRYAHKLGFVRLQDLLHDAGTGQFDLGDLVRIVRGDEPEEPEQPDAPDESKLRAQFDTFLTTAQTSGRPAIHIDGELHTDVATRYAVCCNPIPGDAVFGYVGREGSIKIHRQDCTNAHSLMHSHPERIVDIQWGPQKEGQFVVAVRVVGEDRVGMASDITTVISKHQDTNIRSLNVASNDGIFEGTIVRNVKDLTHLERTIFRLRRIPDVHGVYRFEMGGG
jgi:RelA/SpoT family (p)ppGpp synthetase